MFLKNYDTRSAKRLSVFEKTMEQRTQGEHGGTEENSDDFGRQ